MLKRLETAEVTNINKVQARRKVIQKKADISKIKQGLKND